MADTVISSLYLLADINMNADGPKCELWPSRMRHVRRRAGPGGAARQRGNRGPPFHGRGAGSLRRKRLRPRTRERERPVGRARCWRGSGGCHGMWDRGGGAPNASKRRHGRAADRQRRPQRVERIDHVCVTDDAREHSKVGREVTCTALLVRLLCESASRNAQQHVTRRPGPPARGRLEAPGRLVRYYAHAAITCWRTCRTFGDTQ